MRSGVLLCSCTLLFNIVRVNTGYLLFYATNYFQCVHIALTDHDIDL